MDEENKKTKKGFPIQSVGIITAFILVIAGIAGTYYFYNKYNNTKALLSNPSAINKAESEALLEKLKKLMVLPDEEPSIATILDINKLKDQPFFTNAENGDKVIIYTKAQIAILYSPGKNLIVNVAPVSTTEGQPNTETINVAIYNGTTTTGLTKSAEIKLKEEFPYINVVSRTNAIKNNYQKSLVVDLTGKNGVVASSIATTINADVVAMPEGESTPTGADILTIIGANYQ